MRARHRSRSKALLPGAAALLSATLAAASLSGCVLPPKETPHPRALANEDVGLSGAAVTPAADGWWDSFRDPQLDQLIRRGLKDNPTLAQARSRVSAALAQTQVARAALLPSANLDASRCISGRRRII